MEIGNQWRKGIDGEKGLVEIGEAKGIGGERRLVEKWDFWRTEIGRERRLVELGDW